MKPLECGGFLAVCFAVCLVPGLEREVEYMQVWGRGDFSRVCIVARRGRPCGLCGQPCMLRSQNNRQGFAWGRRVAAVDSLGAVGRGKGKPCRGDESL